MATLLILCFVFILSIIVYYRTHFQRPKNYPPGPTWWPIVENFSAIKKLSILHGGLHLAFQKLFEQFDTKVLGLRLNGNYAVAVSTYPLVRTVLTSDVFEGKPDSFFLRARCMGELRGIVCVDGLLWTEQRNFVDRRIREAGYGKKSTEYLINKELDDIIQVLEKDGPDVEFETLFGAPILNIVWTLLTGISLRKEDPQLKRMLSIIIERAKAFDMAGGALNQYPWLRFIMPDKIGYNLIMKLNKDMKEVFTETINYHHDTWQPGKHDNLIYSYITEMKQEEKKKTFTDEQLIIIFVDLFLGSTQTSGSTISFIMLMMLLHPEVQEKAFENINEMLDPNESLSYADRAKVPYIEAVILEVFRLYPIAALAAPRRALRDSVLEGYVIPQGTTVYASIYSSHYDDKYWDDPHVFRPERFLDDRNKIQFSERVIVFGLGKRRCLGELLARQCIFIFFVGILRRYQICPIPNTVPPSPKPECSILLTPKQFKARLIPRLNNSSNIFLK